MYYVSKIEARLELSSAGQWFYTLLISYQTLPGVGQAFIILNTGCCKLRVLSGFQSVIHSNLMKWKWKRRDWAAVSSELFIFLFVLNNFSCPTSFRIEITSNLSYKKVLRVFTCKHTKMLWLQFTWSQTKGTQYLDHSHAELNSDFKYTDVQRRCVWHFGLTKIGTDVLQTILKS